MCDMRKSVFVWSGEKDIVGDYDKDKETDGT